MDHYIRNSALGELQLAEQETISAHLVKALGRPRGVGLKPLPKRTQAASDPPNGVYGASAGSGPEKTVLMRFDCRRWRLRIAELQFPLFNLRILYLGEKNVRHIEGMPGP